MPTALRGMLREWGIRTLAQYAKFHLPRNGNFDLCQSLEDRQASAGFSIIVPVHDAPQVTGRCLLSLQKYAPEAEVILVDDASRQDETKSILEAYGTLNGWKLVRNPTALGHSGACAAGAELATRPYLCLLNSDTVVTPWCWRPILEAFQENPEIGVAGPSTSYSGTPQALPLAFAARHELSDSQICEYALRLLNDRSTPEFTPLTWISGFAFFVRTSLWTRLNGFDPGIPDIGNEVDFCFRASRAGYSLAWVRRSYIHHLGGESYSKAGGYSSLASA